MTTKRRKNVLPSDYGGVNDNPLPMQGVSRMRTWKKLSMATAGATIVCLATGGRSQAVNLVNNGSFESPPVSGQFATYNTGASIGTNPGNRWRVGSGNVQQIGTYWTDADGTQSIDLNGTQTGSIYQDLITKIGQGYELSFALAGNPDLGPGIPAIKTVAVTFGGFTTTQTFNVTGKSRANMGWQLLKFSVPGSAITSTTTRLRFTSTTPTAYGAAIDRVSVAIPFEFSPGLGILGLGACFAIARLKSQVQKRKFSGSTLPNNS